MNKTQCCTSWHEFRGIVCLAHGSGMCMKRRPKKRQHWFHNDFRGSLSTWVCSKVTWVLISDNQHNWFFIILMRLTDNDKIRCQSLSKLSDFFQMPLGLKRIMPLSRDPTSVHHWSTECGTVQVLGNMAHLVLNRPSFGLKPLSTGQRIFINMFTTGIRTQVIITCRNLNRRSFNWSNTSSAGNAKVSFIWNVSLKMGTLSSTLDAEWTFVETYVSWIPSTSWQ